MIGAGPAGASAAIQLQKEGVRFTMFESNRIGGLLWYANRVDNLIGHRGKTGSQLCEILRSHLEDVGIEVVRKRIERIERSGNLFSVDGSIFTHIILATGSIPVKIDVPGTLYFIENAKDLKGSNILIVGGGDLAFDNAVRTSRSGARVTILFRNSPRANGSLLDEAGRLGIKEIRGDASGILFDGRGYIFEDMRFDLLAAFVGRMPDRSLIEGFGPIEVELPSFSTSIKGLYIVGDAALGKLSQAALSSGSGLAAAMHIAKTVKER